MGKVLQQEFFNRSAVEAAKDLLGKHLVRVINGSTEALIINEVEAYDGPDDLACHGRFGKTKRTEVMFGEAGFFYVYLIYGMYHMLNIVTGPKGYPAAVLIRGVGKLNGPGRLTKNLNIDKSFNACGAKRETGLWLEDVGVTPVISSTPRIGINYAGPVWSKKLYRFVVRST